MEINAALDLIEMLINCALANTHTTAAVSSARLRGQQIRLGVDGKVRNVQHALAAIELMIPCSAQFVSGELYLTRRDK